MNALDLDAWERSADKHLMAYIRRRLSENPRAYGPPNSSAQRAATEILVAYKHGWATDMHEGKSVNRDTGELVPYTIEEQQKAWTACMEMAETEIARPSIKVAA
jgi:hypothetical protein